MDVSIIIVNYNVKYFLSQCLKSLESARKAMSIEIFVVDNHSSDDSIEYLKPLFPYVHFIENKENTGFSRANNQAIKLAKGKYILLLNPDTIVGENTLQNVCLYMDEHSKTGGVGVKMINGKGLFLPESKRGFPSPWNSFCKMFGLSRLFPYSGIFAKYHVKYLDKEKIHQVEVLAGAFMMMRKETLDKIGLLDEDFFMYGEDVDLSYRVVKGGYNNIYLPEKIIHYKGESTKKDLKYIKTFYQSMFIFLKKHYPNYGYFYNFLIKFAIYFHALISSHKRIKKDAPKKIYSRNILIIGNEEECKKISGLFLPSLIKCEQFDFHDDILTINEKLHLKTYTDLVFITGKTKYEDIISSMEALCDMQLNYWIYNSWNETLISSNNAIAKG